MFREVSLFDIEEACGCGGNRFCVVCRPPLARTNDPITSHQAAASIKANYLEALVLRAIRESGKQGMTADELLDKFSHLSYSSITARPASLKRKGLIRDSGERRPGRSGRTQSVLVAT
jgi:hypothetical protein